MSYANYDDMLVQFGDAAVRQLSIRTGDREPTRGVVDAALANASKRIDSYLHGRYTLPLDQTLIDGSDLKIVCCDIARYLLAKDLPPEAVKTRYEEAIRWLRDLSAGRASLGAQDTSATTGSGITVIAPTSGYDWDSY